MHPDVALMLKARQGRQGMSADRSRKHGGTLKNLPRRQREPAKGRQPKRASFCGIDGEGWDVDGRHEYMLLRAGEFKLYTGESLNTWECLRFISNLPKRTWIAFSFGYDVTMILKGIVWSHTEKLIELIKADCDTWTWFGDYGIKWTPKKSFTVKYKGDRGELPAVTVHDTFSFWQSSFVKAIKLMRVCDEGELDLIESGKGKRTDFSDTGIEEIDAYCNLENEIHVRLMQALEARFIEAGASGYPWEGPGPVASKLINKKMRKWVGLDGKTIRETCKLSEHYALGSDGHRYQPDEGPALFATHAYYGGRFERALSGAYRGTEKIRQYDITSAYPYAMQFVPCLEHGVWTWTKRRPKVGVLWVGEVSFEQDPVGACGLFSLPYRWPTGQISFPMVGRGTYWSMEVEKVKGKVTFHGGWKYERKCACRPFQWVEEIFNQRLEMEANEKGSGIALKLIINSLYGKTAQRIGTHPHHNMLYASFITSFTRSMLLDVTTAHPDKIVMAATDAVFSMGEIGELEGQAKKLGSWERSGPYDDFFVWAPGVYFSGDDLVCKTRGIAKRMLQDMSEEMRRAAETFDGTVECRERVGGEWCQPRFFYGLRMGLHQGEKHYNDIGQWMPLSKTLRLDGDRFKRNHENYHLDENGTRWVGPWYSGKLGNTTSTYYEPLEVEERKPIWAEGESGYGQALLTEYEEG